MRLLLLMASALLVVCADPAAAQTRPPLGAPAAPSSPVVRSDGAGFWLNAGTGAGWARLACTICRTDRRSGPTLHLSGGATARSGMQVGVDLDAWTRAEEGIRTLLLSGMVSLRLQPDPARGLHLKAAAGVVRYSLDEGELRATLPGLSLGASYELGLSAGYAITPVANLLASSFGSLRSGDGTVADDVSLTLLQLGIALQRR